MKSNSKRTLVIILIITCAILIGVATDIVWSRFKEHEFPLAYIEPVEKYSAEYGIPKEIIFAIIKTESNFNTAAISRVGALGLMQMMPSTFEWLTGDEHLNEHLPSVSLATPETSIKYGTYYISYLRDRFFSEREVDWDIIFAAYNGGEGNVEKWLADPELVNENGNLVNIPFPETRSYISKVNSAIDTYKQLYPDVFK